MYQALYAHWFVPLCIFAIAACFIAIGLRGLLLGHPFVVTARWIVLFTGLWVAMQFYWVVETLVGGHLRRQWPLPLMGTVAIAVIVTIVWFSAARSYFAYGITTTSLHDGLRASLQTLGLRSAVGFGGVYLSPSGTHISVSIFNSRGVGRIRVDRSARPLLRDVVAGMNRYYADANIAATVRSAFYRYIAAGLLLLGVTGFDFWWR